MNETIVFDTIYSLY